MQRTTPRPRMQGPKSFEEIWKWPSDVNDLLLGNEKMAERYTSNMKDGVIFRLHYAGCLTETVGMNYVADDLRKRSVGEVNVRTVHSCDFADGPQKIFHNMPEELRPTHGFMDIEDLLPIDVRMKLDDIQPNFREWVSSKNEVERSSIKEKHMQAYMKMATYLKRTVENGSFKGNRAKCIRHDK
eukprot:7778936-Pyramimonas_sp.AAC.1